MKSTLARLRRCLALSAASLTWSAAAQGQTPPPAGDARGGSARDTACDTACKAAWRDPSPHAVRTVAVAPGVQLEVLDWGGTGDPLVFLPGLGNTAHAFDVFAPRFRDAYRVYGITPRGFGASSHPDSGYDSRTRARDVLAVLDSLGITRAVLVGHSIAGDEITRLAVEHPKRVRALVYLDAYSYGPDESRLADWPPEPPQARVPAMTAADSASVPAVVAYWARRFHLTPVEAEVRAVSRFAPSGRLELFQAPNASAQVYAGTARSDYLDVRAPALAIYRRHPTVQSLFPEWPTFDAENRRMAERFFAFDRRDHAAQVGRFRREVRCGVVRELPDANHYVHYTNATEVERLIRAFLTGRLPTRSRSCRVPASN